MLWEALAGRHPFWAVSPLETARRVEQGAQPLAELRPDLPELCRAVDRAFGQFRVRARRALGLLEPQRRTGRRRRARTSRPSCANARRTALAALFAGGTAFLLPFFPSGWPFLLGAAAALAALDVAGLAAALAVPVLPLKRLARARHGLRPARVAWLVLFARDVRSSLLFLSGPALAFVHLLPLVPVIVLEARGPVRRAALAVRRCDRSRDRRRRPAPSSHRRPPAPEPRGVSGAETPGSALDGALGVLTSRPTIVAAIVIVGIAAASASLARSRGLWGVAAWGAAFLGALLLVPVATGGVSVDPSGQPLRSGSRRPRSHIRWFGRLDRVRGHNSARYGRPAKHRAQDRVDR